MSEPTWDRGLTEPERIEAAAQLMMGFAGRTGVEPAGPARRYLWTDAFAVCNFLGLAHATGEARYLDLALRLVDYVHAVLGRHREDDPRSGWLSQLTERQRALHPTAGGLRIGKRLPERGAYEPFDESLEWERDGQYYHYLTKWMHALDQVARHTGEPRFNRWARELAKVAHDAFTFEFPGGSGRRRMVWKMSTDLTRVLVPSMGQHDPLDGFVTAIELLATAAALPEASAGPHLTREITYLADTIDVHGLSTADPLGIGGLLVDACRLAQLEAPAGHDQAELQRALLEAAARGLQRYLARGELHQPPGSRLAFREIGLSIGLKAVPLMTELARAPAAGQRTLEDLYQTLEPYAKFGAAIDACWLDPAAQRARSWSEHLDINEVMLATSLLPDGFLVLSTPPARASAAGPTGPAQD